MSSLKPVSIPGFRTAPIYTASGVPTLGLKGLSYVLCPPGRTFSDTGTHLLCGLSLLLLGTTRAQMERSHTINLPNGKRKKKTSQAPDSPIPNFVQRLLLQPQGNLKAPPQPRQRWRAAQHGRAQLVATCQGMTQTEMVNLQVFQPHEDPEALAADLTLTPSR